MTRSAVVKERAPTRRRLTARGRLLPMLVIAVFLMNIGMTPAVAQGQPLQQPNGAPVPGQCGVLPMPGGSLGLFCVPASGWNGDLIVWAHGYRRVTESLAFQDLELADGSNLPTITQSLGFAFVATTYRQNGLTVLEGLDDIRELVVTFRLLTGRAPRHTYMAGASMGGLVTTLLLERSPELFSGGLALCGPIGDFRKELEYVGDFRLLFDAFYPRVLPGNGVRIPDELIRDWDRVYVPRINAAVSANPLAALSLISTSKAAIDAASGPSVLETIRNVLAYSTFSANDATAKLGGNPYGNLVSIYTGSFDDARLNQLVLRVAAEPVTLLTLQPYQTSGRLTLPLVTMHTTRDEIVPFWHQLLYQQKARPSGRGRVTPIAIDRYGHCNFTGLEALVAFGLLVEQVTGSQPAGLSQRLDAGQVKRDYERAAQQEAPRVPQGSR